MSEYLDLATWRRRDHFRLFLDHGQPFFSVTVPVDVTPLRARCDAPGGPSFFLAAIWCAVEAVNAVEAFRLRLRGERVWRHDRIGLGTTIRRADDTFGFAQFHHGLAFDDFQRAGAEEVQRVKNGIELDAAADRDDLVYHSTLPWLRFTSFNNALSLRDSIPRIAFGRVTKEGERAEMPVAVEVHHSLVDGLDVARFYERFEARFQAL